MRERALSGENWRGILTLNPPSRASLRGGPCPTSHVAKGTGQPQPSSDSNSRPRCAHSQAPLRAGEQATAQLPGAPGKLPQMTPRSPHPRQEMGRGSGEGLVPHPTCPVPDPQEARSVPRAGEAPPRGQRRRRRGCGLRAGAGALPVPLDRSHRAGARAGLPLARRWRLQPRTCPHTSGVFPRVTPPRPGLGAPAAGKPPRRDTCARGARPSPLGAEHGLPHPAAGTRASAGRGPPRPPGPAGRHLPGPTSAPLAPAAGPQRSGLRPGSGRALTALRRRRARLPAAPRAPLQKCVRSARPAPGLGAHGLRLPLAAGVGAAPGRPEVSAGPRRGRVRERPCGTRAGQRVSLRGEERRDHAGSGDCAAAADEAGARVTLYPRCSRHFVASAPLPPGKTGTHRGSWAPGQGTGPRSPEAPLHASGGQASDRHPANKPTQRQKPDSACLFLAHGGHCPHTGKTWKWDT